MVMFLSRALTQAKTESLHTARNGGAGGRDLDHGCTHLSGNPSVSGTRNARSVRLALSRRTEEHMLKKLLTPMLAASLIIAVGCGQTDPGVTTAVKSKLAADDTVKAYQINVDTADGVVTLSGTVETQAEKNQAMSLARQTNGVRDVVDQIAVNPEAAATTGELAGEARETARDVREEADTARDKAASAADRTQNAVTDAAITSGVKGKFLADSAVSGLKIDVDTSEGVVTLAGTVSTSAEADRAVTLARETNGVTRVINNLRVGR